jgi:hypothetical protein
VPKKHGEILLVLDESHGSKRALDALALAQPAVQFGVVVERLFPRVRMKIFRRKLTGRCIEPEFPRYCPNLFEKKD